MIRFPKIDRLSIKLGLSIALLVVLGLAAALVLVYRYYTSHLVSMARTQAGIQSQLIGLALEHDMLGNDRTLLRRMVSSFARGVHAERVMVLDRHGQVRISSDPSIGLRHFSPSDPTCRVCHRSPPTGRAREVMLEMGGGTVLRSVRPIPNREACHKCHDPAHRINGLLIVDVPIHSTLAKLETSLWHLGAGATAFALVLLGGIGLSFRRLVMRRLRRFEATAHAIAEGDLERRVPIEGEDALTRLEVKFNRMADSVTGLLERLRQQRANLERVMNSVDDGMVVLDRVRNVVAVNDAYMRRLGHATVEAGAMLGRSCCAAAPGADPRCLVTSDGECPTEACFSSGRVQLSIRTREDEAGGGGLRIEEVHASPVLGPDGRITHVVEVWRDITDRRSAEARLAEYQRMVSLGMLASGFSHEVNTPLASIATCLDGIKRLCSANPAAAGSAVENGGGGNGGGGRAAADPSARVQQVLEYARIAGTQVQRCGAITQQFLQMARGRSLSKEVLDLPACAASVARLVEPTVRRGGVGIEIDPPPAGYPCVLANAGSVQQVFLNLLMNAAEASDPGKVVRVGFRSGEEAVEVTVRDEGRGIAPADLPRVFEPFFSRRANGTGLGLFVSMGFARAWGGDILVESQLSVGSTFRVVFPTAGPARPDGPEAGAGNERRGEHGGP